MLHKALRFLEKLEQPIFLGERESISHRCGLACKRSQGWETSRGLVLRRRCSDVEHTPYPHPKTTRSPAKLSRFEPEILPGGDMDLFNLISAPNPAVIKNGTHPRVAHEVPYNNP
ncbi:hypothetical protein Tco_1535441 [Tanacetum coccineum]